MAWPASSASCSASPTRISAISSDGWLTMGMLLSLPLLAFGGWLIVRAYRATPCLVTPVP